MLSLLLAFACAPEGDSGPYWVPADPPSEMACPSGRVTSVHSDRPIYLASVTIPSGADVLVPLMAMGGQYDFTCPPEGGELRLEWGD